MSGLYKEHKWEAGSKTYVKARLSPEGTEAAHLALGKKLTAIGGPKPDGERRSVSVPFCSVSGFHQALAVAAQYLHNELEGKAPLGRYFWCEVSESDKGTTMLIEAGAY